MPLQEKLERWIISPLTIPILTAMAVLAVVLSTVAIINTGNAREAERKERAAAIEAERVDRAYDLCQDINELRRDLDELGGGVETLIRTILNVTLRPGEGDAERQLAVREVYDRFRPEFERYGAVLTSIAAQTNCKE